MMRKLYFYAQYIMMIMFVIIIFYAGPILESKFFPVVERFEIDKEATIQNNDGVSIFGVVVKVRDCSPIPGSFSVFTEELSADGITPSKEVFLRNGSVIGTTHRPLGAQYFGPWTMIKPSEPFGPSLVIRMKHRCHPFWDIDTVLYRGLTSEFFPNGA